MNKLIHAYAELMLAIPFGAIAYFVFVEYLKSDKAFLLVASIICLLMAVFFLFLCIVILTDRTR